MAVVLEPLGMRWIDKDPLNRDDQCVHGEARLAVDGIVLVSPDDGEFTLSAATTTTARKVA